MTTTTEGAIEAPRRGWRASLDAWLESRPVQGFVIGLILLNAITFGLETFDSVMAVAGPQLHLLDQAILVVFVIELLLRFAARGLRLFRDPWAVFDVLVVGLALAPATGSLSALRAFRVLRVLRLISAAPSMRRVVESLLRAIPGIGSIGALISVVLYVAAVIGSRLFGDTHPQYFGDLGTSLLTLFQVLTVEGWPDIQRSIMEQHPLAWIYFVPFLLISTFVILNLFVGVIVDSMQSEVVEETQAVAEQAAENDAELSAKLDALHAELQSLRAELAAGRAAEQPPGS